MAVMDKLMSCALCPNICRFICPMEEVWATESSSPSGKARTALLLLQGQIPWNKENVKILYQCLTCWASKEPCPFEDLIIGDLLVEVRKEAVKRGVIIPEVAVVMDSLKEYDNPYGEKREKFEPPMKEAEFMYFPGCTAELREKEIISATITVLKKAGVNAHILKGLCCGWPALQMGDEEGFLRLAKRTEGAIEACKGQILFVSCPSCFEYLTKIYPERGLDLKVKVVHTSTFFLNLLKDGKIPVKAIRERVAYHDPCALGRKMGIYDEPRVVLHSLGLKVIEPEKTREFATCCGGGGLVEKSLKVAQKRKEELLSTGAELFVTACPTCKMMFNKAKLKVQDLSELLAMSLG
jgi:heterodisulfide reductase subunit D